MEEDRASIKEKETAGNMGQEDSASVQEACRKMDNEDRASELKDYFTALEENRRNMQNLLQEQKEEYEMELRALERESVQEREMRNRK